MAVNVLKSRQSKPAKIRYNRVNDMFSSDPNSNSQSNSGSPHMISITPITSRPPRPNAVPLKTQNYIQSKPKPQARVKPRVYVNQETMEKQMSKSMNAISQNSTPRLSSYTQKSPEMDVPSSQRSLQELALSFQSLQNAVQSTENIKSSRDSLTHGRAANNFLGAIYESPDNAGRKTMYKSHRSSQEVFFRSESLLHKMSALYCQDCDLEIHYLDYSPAHKSLCARCVKVREQRRLAIIELIQSEIVFGDNMRSLLKDMSDKMLKAGLITKNENQTIFGNLPDLIRHNGTLLTLFREEIRRAMQMGDQDYATLEIGRYFIDCSPMFIAFELYCRSLTKGIETIEEIEQNREVVKVFLEVCQSEIAILQKISLKSWLISPVQRLTKYPMLLNRIKQCTPQNHNDWLNLKRAIQRISSHLKRINSYTVVLDKTSSNQWNVRVAPGLETLAGVGRTDMTDWQRIACRELKSKPEETVLVMADYIGFEKVSLKNKMLKRQRRYVAMLVISNQMADYLVQEEKRQLLFLVLKEIANSAFIKIRELDLDQMCFALSEENQSILEVTDILTSETTRVKFCSHGIAEEWLNQCQSLTKLTAKWQKRRNAMPNIMLGLLNQT